MDAWIEDAQLLTDEKDLTKSQQSLLKRTAAVDDFLSDPSLPSKVLVAPKGFGKTFVLKLKRISLQGQGHSCLPHRIIVDRPRATAPILPLDILDLLTKSENWETFWQISFTIAILKGYRADTEAQEFLQEIKKSVKGNARLETILSRSSIETPFEIIHHCLGGSRSELYDIIDKSEFITAAYSRFSRQCAIFVDNIDEYLERYINIDRDHGNDIHTSYLKLWHNGQIGAWLALRRLQGANPRIRIYVSLRKEAYEYASHHQPSFSNLKAFAIELRYSMSDIKEIVENNISNMPAEKLVDRSSTRPIVKFVGAANEFVSNSGTGKNEPILDYWLRHCTGRPRDAVAIGSEISKKLANDRTLATVRSAINHAASERVLTLFSDSAPFFDGFFPDIFIKVIKSNVLTRAQIETASKDYSNLALETYGQASESVHHPFCALYAISLIGIVTEDRDKIGNLVQRFSAVGQVPLGSLGVLPYAETYLIHPSLSDFIIAKDVTYLSNLNRHNIVGDGLEWRPEEEIRFVVLGDMRGFRSKIMGSVGGSQTFDTFWTGLFTQYTRGLDFAQLSGGDSLLLVDRSPVRLIRALRGLATNLRRSRYDLQLRVGGHSGHWRLNLDSEGVARPEMSDIVGVAARLEPFGTPGSIIFTETFLQDARRLGPGIDRENVRAAAASDFPPSASYDEASGLLISKSKEPEQRFRCFMIENIELSE